MPYDRIAKLRAFLTDCSHVYGIGDVDEDLEAADLTAATLATSTGQMKLAHMRFARDLACWRSLRRCVGGDSAAVVSLCTGPGTPLLGWFYDTPPASEQPLLACDPLDWLPLRELPSLHALWADVLVGREHLDYRGGVLLPDAVPQGATVLASLVLPLDIDQESKMLAWLHEQRGRGCRIVLAGPRQDREPGLWQRIGAGLRIDDQPNLFRASGLADFANAFPQKAAWGFRRTRDHLSLSTALLGTADGWRFLDGSST